MQHFDIASVRASAIALPCDAVLALDPVLEIKGWDAIDTSTEELALPVSDFTIDAEEEALLAMTRSERQRSFKASTKARQQGRRQARAAKRASRDFA